VAARLLLSNHIRLTARCFHLAQRPQCFRFGFEPATNIGPRDSSMSVYVLLEASLQCMQQFCPFLRIHVLHRVFGVDCGSAVLLATPSV